MAEETLLPGTRMIPRATLQWESYRGKELVRFRHHNGIVHRGLFESPAEAEHFFFVQLEKLKEETRNGGKANTSPWRKCSL